MKGRNIEDGVCELRGFSATISRHRGGRTHHKRQSAALAQGRAVNRHLVKHCGRPRRGSLTHLSLQVMLPTIVEVTARVKWFED